MLKDKQYYLNKYKMISEIPHSRYDLLNLISEIEEDLNEIIFFSSRETKASRKEETLEILDFQKYLWAEYKNDLFNKNVEK